MKHVICYRNDNPDEITYEYDYDDTPEIETPEMIDRCFHDYDTNEYRERIRRRNEANVAGLLAMYGKDGKGYTNEKE